MRVNGIIPQDRPEGRKGSSESGTLLFHLVARCCGKINYIPMKIPRSKTGHLNFRQFRILIKDSACRFWTLRSYEEGFSERNHVVDKIAELADLLVDYERRHVHRTR